MTDFLGQNEEENRNLLQVILAQVPLGVVVTDAQRHIIYVNRIFTQETGYTLAEVLGKSCNFLQGPGTNPADVQAIREALAARAPVQRTLLNYRKDGQELLYQVSITPVFQEGALRYFVGMQQDVTLLRRTQHALELAALTDSLTGLGNRRALDLKLDQYQKAVKPFALVVADLDNLKRVNDCQGHVAGDQQIQAAAQMLADLCSPADLAFRVGGDEFVVLISPVDSESLDVRVTQWRANLSNLQQTLSLSIGIANFPEDHNDVWGVFSDADRRMYIHKARSHGPADS